MDQLDATDPSRVGPYALLGRLGTGGMGQVYLGRSAAGRTVAVKVVRPELAGDAGFRERFRREVAAARAVSGAFTAPLVDSDANAETPWMAARFVSGIALREAVRRHGPLPEAPLRMLLAGIAEALVGVHAAGLVHRDLKPANVMLALDGPHVIDFGIARAMDGTPFTAAGSVMGTPGYMAPEQTLAHPATAASDVFALGATILYAASGASPFGNGRVVDVLRRSVHDSPDLSAVPPSIREVMEHCLAKDPERRPGPRDVIAYIESGGPPVASGSWLPPGLTADIVAVDQVMAGRAARPPGPPSGPPAESTAGSLSGPASEPPSSATTAVQSVSTTVPAPASPTAETSGTVGTAGTAGTAETAPLLASPTSATVPTPGSPTAVTRPASVADALAASAAGAPPGFPPPAPPAEPPPAPPHPPTGPGSPTRRKLVIGLVGVGAVAAAGGVAAAMALSDDGGSGKSGSASSPGASPSASGTAPAAPPASASSAALPPATPGALPPPTGLREMLDGPVAVVRGTTNVKEAVVALSVRAGSLIAATGTGRHAFDGTGKPLWSLPVLSFTGNPGTGASADGRVLYFVGSSGVSMEPSIVAADAGSGAKLWSLPVPHRGWSVSTVAGVVGDTVVVTGIDAGQGSGAEILRGSGFVWAVDARGRQTAWEASGPDVGAVFVSSSGRAVLGGRSVTSTGAFDGQLQLIDVANRGARGWVKPVPAGLMLTGLTSGTGGVSWIGDNVVCAARDAVVALNGATGDQLWSFKPTTILVESCAATPDGSKVFAVDYQSLYCIDGSTGRLVWKTILRSGVFGSTAPIAYDAGNVYTLDSGGTLWAVDAATGITRWKYRDPARTHSVALPWTAVGGTVYVAQDKTVSMLDASGL